MRFLGCFAAALVAAGLPAVRADELKLASGAVKRGLVLERTAEHVTFKIVLASGSMVVRYPVGQIESLRIDGREPVFDRPAAPVATPAPAPPKPSPSPPGPSAPTPAAKPPATPKELSRSDVLALIDKTSKTPPDWWDSVKLDYPSTLDLPGATRVGGWQPQRNLGAYFFSVVTPNPHRWRPGIKLWHYVLTVRKDDRVRLREAMRSLADCYFRYEKDYARAAFWWQKAQAGADSVGAHDLVGLADCYFHLGSRAMAEGLLGDYGLHRDPYSGSIKLYAEMGQTRRALDLAAIFVKSGMADEGYLLTGNIHRLAGQHDEAIDAYQKVLDTRQGSRRIKQNKQRAAVNLQAVKLYEALKLDRIADGTYAADCVGYRGPIHVEVVVAGGRIADCKVSRHREDIFFTSIVDVPKQIVDKQSVRGIDAISGATVTSEAIVNAVAKALAGGLR